LFQKKDKLGPHETFYKFAFMGLFLMISIIFVFGLFFGASKLGDSGYDIKSEATTAQPSTTTSKIYISLHLLLNLVSSLIFNAFQMITSQPLKLLMQVLFAKVRINNTLINIRFISSKLQIISVEAGGEESWISDDSCDDVNNNQFCNYDGGDCCGANVIKQYCIDCDCLSK
jgi:hypothetical protein